MTPVVARSALFLKAREFTDIENKTLDVWLRAENAGLDDLAAEVLDAGLMFEHYRSLLDADPANWTAQQHTEHDELSLLFATQSQAVEDALADLEREHQGKSPLTGEGQGGDDTGSGKGDYDGLVPVA